MKYTHITINILLISGFLTACNKEGPSISVGSHTLNESTIKSEMPDFYKQVKAQYNQQLYQYLKRMATQKLIELEAAEKSQKPKEYMNALINKIPRPTEAEIAEGYEELNSTGQSQGKALAEIRDQVIGYVMNHKREITVARELGRLRKKYNYKDSTEVRQQVSIDGAAVRGNPDAKVTIIEFSDYECPYCAKSQATTRKLRKMYGDKLRFAFRNFPLDFHKNATYAHRTGICIYKQSPDKYWTYFDTLFARQLTDRSAIAGQKVKQLAASVGANMQSLTACIDDPATQEQITSEMKMGSEAGVSGTPAFFINGRFINGAVPLGEFVGVIEEELAN